MSYIDIITRVNDDHERPTLIRIGGPKTKATTKKKHKDRPADGSSRLQVNQ